MSATAMFRRLFDAKPRTYRHPKPAPRPRLAIQELEVRSLMAASLVATFDMAQGLLRVEGTDNADQIRIVHQDGSVAVEGITITVTDLDGNTAEMESVDSSLVLSAAADALGGNDTVVIDDSAVVNDGLFAVYVFGGDGDDSLTAGRVGGILFGEAGNDTLICGDGGNQVYAGDGDDTITGGNGDDFLSGQGGDDSVVGNAGNDTIYGGDGDDVVSGDAGADLIYGEAGTDQITGGATGDTLVGGDGSDVVHGGDGNDVIKGGQEWSAAEAGGADDKLYGEAGSDAIWGGDGADTIVGGDGRDAIYGESGNDTLKGADEFSARETAGDNMDYILGGVGSDAIWGGDGADTLVGGDGRDALYGEGGNDTLKGADEFSARETVGDNMDYILGGVGSDAIWGGDGADTLVGGNGNDSLFGEEGNDTMKGADEFNAYETTGNNADYMLGGAGNDAMWGGHGNDTLVGGDGSDALYGEIGEDILKGAQEFNAHEAGGDADLLDGGIGNDTLWGGDGDDALHGGPGTDRLYGEAGNDGLFAGMGDGVESLLGGPGADRFLTLDGEDVIQDREGIDARIAFRNSPALSGVKLAGQTGTYSFAAGSWNNAEVDRVDVALANLHHHTGNTRLLKSAARGEMSFLAVGMQTSPGFQAGGWNSGSEIAFVNLPAIATSYIQRTVYHEFGHNWDDQSENRFVNTFRAVSGWQVHDNGGGSLFPPAGYNGSLDGAWDYRASAANTFAREYGKTNPNEDMASTWEAYFVNAYHGGAAQLVVEGLTMNGAKWATLDSLFGDLRAAW